jgi:dinuclear metal center YbgI/SA1388 family protein
VVEQAVREGADLILTHHPILFSPLKTVSDADFVGRRVELLIRNDIAAYAMHTNFDVLGMADAAADAVGMIDREVLEVTYEDEVSKEGIGRIGKLPEFMKLDDFAALVRDAFGLEQVRVYGDGNDAVITCAILPGSGKEEIDLAVAAGADVYVTGDMNHHAGIDAVEKGIAVIDAGHYGGEKLFVPYMKDYLRRELPVLEVITAPQGEPCRLV